MMRRERKERKRAKQARGQPQRREIGIDEIKAILDRVKGVLSTDEYEKLAAAIDALAFLTRELEAKGTSIERLRRLLFGASTEKTSRVFGDASQKTASDAESGACPSGRATGGDTAGKSGTGESADKKRKGHGRNGAAAYPGAQHVKVPHPSLKVGDPCPCCGKGKVYHSTDPAYVVRVVGMAPLGATVYEKERLRCNACLEVFTAKSPPGVGEDKYDETATSMVALLKYGCGVPFNRLARLQVSLGIPMPAATQWELVHAGAGLLQPAYAEMIRQAAQGRLLHNDDTTMRILELGSATPADTSQAAAGDDEEKDERTGVFTTGIVSVGQGHQIACFFTGNKHAGENLETLLSQRAAELAPPIQMCDALSRNTTGDFETILAHCLAHARRRFVEVADHFPDECRYALETLRGVYKNDDDARQADMAPEERLRFHQQNSGPLMADLERWLREQIEQRLVEPNSGLGEAIGYMRRHWQELTLFLREPGAPLDNNICERSLKKAILHRKNALFYKTQTGARVGDLYMTLIHTAELAPANPFDYLVALQRYHEDVEKEPAAWMPWNYVEALARVRSGPGPPS
jgi:transposase